jgi:hypothetical protein
MSEQGARAARAEHGRRPRAALSFNIAGSMSIAGYLAGVRGDPERAQDLLEPAWELMQHSGSFQLVGLALAWRIALSLWRGELDRARRMPLRSGRRRPGSGPGPGRAPSSPGHRGRPPRSQLVCAERGNPVEVRAQVR